MLAVLCASVQLLQQHLDAAAACARAGAWVHKQANCSGKHVLTAKLNARTASFT
jgi:hypothetical protein